MLVRIQEDVVYPSQYCTLNFSTDTNAYFSELRDLSTPLKKMNLSLREGSRGAEKLLILKLMVFKFKAIVTNLTNQL